MQGVFKYGKLPTLVQNVYKIRNDRTSAAVGRCELTFTVPSVCDVRAVSPGTCCDVGDVSSIGDGVCAWSDCFRPPTKAMTLLMMFTLMRFRRL